MKLKKIGANSIILSICELLVGILLFIAPERFTSSIIMVVGIVLCVLGLRSLFLYFREEPLEAVKSNHFLVGMLFLLAGGFCAVRSDWFITAFPLLTVIYGIAILLTALTKLQEAVNKLRLKYTRWYIIGGSALLSMLCGIVILANPFSATETLWVFIGITLIVEAALDLASVIFSKAVNAAPAGQTALVESDYVTVGDKE